LPTLIERTGTSAKSAGSITSIYTVLADGDDVTSDPVVDISRAILDGHIVLTRELSQQGIYPAIDATKSISRLMNDIVSPEHRENAVKLKRLISKYYANHDLVMMGGYVNGQDQDLDTALRLWPQIERFLKQDYAQTVSFDQSVSQLNDLVGQMS
jgi:flagellum-specific ATP synthase